VAKQEQVAKPAPQTREQDAAQLAEEDAAVQAAQSTEQPDLSDLDELLDEIDTILEEQDVLVNFRQKGGE
jgi:hypothetical protein